MSYVYLLSYYGEDGSHSVLATLDRSKVATLMPDIGSKAMQGLSDLLAKHDEELAAPAYGGVGHDGWDCDTGWGGLMLHVIPL